ncbi:MAG: glycoside hydrolase family 26 protein [Bacillus subtilis]|nr:glycoside hydrolase family 26 protein [Bacillus subtilis]
MNYDIESDYLPRVNFGQKYEPKGNYILHGAGQAANGVTVSFDEYVEAVGMTPAVSMGYAAPHHNFVEWAELMIEGLERYPADYIMLQIGVHFNRDEDPNNTYYQEIADGEMDMLVKALLRVLKRFNRPVYVRPGFEFNGEWNGYTDAAVYRRAFIRFYELIQEVEAKNIALLWCYNPDAREKNYLKYYPRRSVRRLVGDRHLPHRQHRKRQHPVVSEGCQGTQETRHDHRSHPVHLRRDRGSGLGRMVRALFRLHPEQSRHQGNLLHQLEMDGLSPVEQLGRRSTGVFRHGPAKIHPGTVRSDLPSCRIDGGADTPPLPVRRTGRLLHRRKPWQTWRIKRSRRNANASGWRRICFRRRSS